MRLSLAASLVELRSMFHQIVYVASLHPLKKLNFVVLFDGYHPYSLQLDEAI